MDPHGQHELEDNDLADFFENFGAWWNAYGNYVLVVLVIAAAGVFAWSFITNRARAEHESAWTDLAFNSSPQGYSEVAQSHGNATVRSLAYLRAGDLLLGQAISPQQPKDAGENKGKGEGQGQGNGKAGSEQTGSEQSASTKQENATAGTQDGSKAKPDRATALRQAGQAYQQALQAADKRVFRLNALLGLAAVAESKRDWTAAKKHYHQVIDKAGDTYVAVRDQARKRLSLLSEMQRPVKFAPPPPPPSPSSPPSSPSSNSSTSETSTSRPSTTPPSASSQPRPPAGKTPVHQTPAAKPPASP